MATAGKTLALGAGLAFGLVLASVSAANPLRYDLAIRKTGPTSVYAGDTATYTLTAINLGSQPVGAAGNGTGALISDAIPTGFVLVSPQNSSSSPFFPGGNGWTCLAPNLTCGYGGPAVPPGSAFPPLVVTLKAVRAGSYQQCASVSYQGQTDAVAGNNRSCVAVTVRQKPR